MPIFCYECERCGAITEEMSREHHKHVKCESCGGKAEYVIKPCSISIKNDNLAQERFMAKAKKEYETRNELFEEFGIDRIGTVYNKSKMNILDLQKDIREHSSEVKECIAKDAELTRQKVAKRLKKFNEESWSRRKGKIEYFKQKEHREKLAQRKKDTITVSP